MGSALCTQVSRTPVLSSFSVRLASSCSCACMEVCRKFSAVAAGPALPGQALLICQCESGLASNPSLDNPVLFLHTKAVFLTPLAWDFWSRAFSVSTPTACRCDGSLGSMWNGLLSGRSELSNYQPWTQLKLLSTRTVLAILLYDMS